MLEYNKVIAATRLSRVAAFAWLKIIKSKFSNISTTLLTMAGHPIPTQQKENKGNAIMPPSRYIIKLPIE